MVFGSIVGMVPRDMNSTRRSQSKSYTQANWDINNTNTKKGVQGGTSTTPSGTVPLTN